MTFKAKDLSPEQKLAIEKLLGRCISEDEVISIHAEPAPSVPEWLHASWNSAVDQALDRLSPEEIEAEIAAARSHRRENRLPGQ